MNRILAIIYSLISICLLSCTNQQGETTMFPDYKNVKIPKNIAPLNFHYSGQGTFGAVTEFRADKICYRFKGRKVIIPAQKWESLKDAALKNDGQIRVSSSLLGEWKIEVSHYSIDPYMTYRLIEPAYEVWNKVEIRQRCLENFEEKIISSHQNTQNSCMNCHIHSGEHSFFYLRGPKGGAILNRKGEGLRKISLKTEGMISSTVYGELHPSGRWGIFSTNIIIPALHTNPNQRLEVFDRASDLCIVDFDNGQIIIEECLARNDRFETFPCFSGTGEQIYYCVADTVKLPENVNQLKYSLTRASFNPESGSIGSEEIIWDASEHGTSVCHPKVSKDGRYLIFTVADYGTFPIWHKECDLYIMDLISLESRAMEEINSTESDTYHSWSSNNRFICFASKRGDGVYGRPYIAYIDENGRASKPFVLPQKDPYLYEKTLKSFNIPDLGPIDVGFNYKDIAELRDDSTIELFNSKQ